MSISPVGNSDAYARYRQQALDLLAAPGQSATKPPPTTTSPSYVTPPNSTDQTSSNLLAPKFNADLTSLNPTQHGTSHTHGAHGHHHHGANADASTNATDPTSAASASGTTTNTDPLSQSLEEFANLLKTAAGVAAVIA